MNILICDDDIKITEQIKNLLQETEKKNSIIVSITEMHDGKEVINSQLQFDIAFIDIEMPEVNGLEAAKYLQKSNPNIIIFIVTSYSSYLDEAMDLKVFRYLSKPIDEQRFIKNLNAAMELYRKSTHVINVKNTAESRRIYTRDILYLTIEKRHGLLVTTDGSFITSDTFESRKQQLMKYDYFAQSHYSFVVNMKNVTAFTKTDITITLNEKNVSVPVSRRFYKSFEEAFYRYIGGTI